MKTTKLAAYAAAVIPLLFALTFIAGCGGGNGTIGHTIVTPFHGALAGAATEPVDGDTNIETSHTDSWIHVFWPNAGSPPPSTFTVTVEKEERPGVYGGIHTVLSLAQSDPIGGSWWFQPVNDFSPDTWYRITIKVPGEDPGYAFFQTASTLGRSGALAAPKGYRPAGTGDAVGGESSVTHTITK